MSKKFIFLLVCFFSLSFIPASSSALEFSADMIFTSGGQRTEGKIFSKPDRFRMEMAGPEQMITISRMDRNVAYSIMPSQRMYMEIPLSPSQAPMTEIMGETERKLVGSETVNGHPTEKYLITYTRDGQTDKVHQWIATDINFPIKTADLNNRWVQEYRNVRIGPQKDSLFEVPEGYSKLEIPSMPGMMQEGMPGKMPGGMNFR